MGFFGNLIGIRLPHASIVTPDPRPTGARPGRAGSHLGGPFFPTAYAATGIEAQLLALLGLCSIVNGVRAPRLAIQDQPSPSKPFIPTGDIIITQERCQGNKSSCQPK